MPSNRKQKAKERRSRRSDLMSDIENLDVMLGSYQRDNCEIQNGNDDDEIDPRSIGREESPNQNENDYRTHLNANPSENSCLTVETSRAINSEISTQMSRIFEELQSSLKSQILDVTNTAIEIRVIPKMQLAGKIQRKMQIWTIGQMDCIKVMRCRKILRRTYGQINCIQKILVNQLRTLRMSFRDWYRLKVAKCITVERIQRILKEPMMRRVTTDDIRLFRYISTKIFTSLQNFRLLLQSYLFFS